MQRWAVGGTESCPRRVAVSKRPALASPLSACWLIFQIQQHQGMELVCRMFGDSLDDKAQMDFRIDAIPAGRRVKVLAGAKGCLPKSQIQRPYSPGIRAPSMIAARDSPE